MSMQNNQYVWQTARHLILHWIITMKKDRYYCWRKPVCSVCQKSIWDKGCDQTGICPVVGSALETVWFAPFSRDQIMYKQSQASIILPNCSFLLLLFFFWSLWGATGAGRITPFCFGSSKGDHWDQIQVPITFSLAAAESKELVTNWKLPPTPLWRWWQKRMSSFFLKLFFISSASSQFSSIPLGNTGNSFLKIESFLPLPHGRRDKGGGGHKQGHLFPLFPLKGRNGLNRVSWSSMWFPALKLHDSCKWVQGLLQMTHHTAKWPALTLGHRATPEY